jgi:hypothetical protein
MTPSSSKVWSLHRTQGDSLAEAVRHPGWGRAHAWEVARQARLRAEEAGFAGTVLMGCRFETLVEEAFWAWRRPPDGADPRARLTVPVRVARRSYQPDRDGGEPVTIDVVGDARRRWLR